MKLDLKFWKEKLISKKTEGRQNVDMAISNKLNTFLDELEFGKKILDTEKAEDVHVEKDKEPTCDYGNDDWFIKQKQEGHTTGWDFLETEAEKVAPLSFLEEVEVTPVLKYYITDEFHRKVGEGVIDEEQLPFIVGRDPEKTDLCVEDEPDSNGNYMIARQFFKIDKVNALFKVERINNPDFGMMIREDGVIRKTCKPVLFDEKVEMILSRPRNPKDVKVRELHISLYDYKDEYEDVFLQEAVSLKTQTMPVKEKIVEETEEEDFDIW